MDRARQDWVHEYAETRMPDSPEPQPANSLHGTGTMVWAQKLHSRAAVRPCTRRRWNGPAEFLGRSGRSRSAIGSPQYSTRSACSFQFLPRFHAPRGREPRSKAVPFAFPRSSAPPIPFLPCSSPSLLAAGTGCHRLPDGKVRWQKRFVSPARRMRRGWQS